MKIIVILLLLFCMLVPPLMAQSSEEPADEVESLLANMSLEQKVGQMFMVTLYGKALTETGEAFIRDYQPGAVAIFGFNTDFETGEHVALLINNMQSASSIPLIIASDEEGGTVRRIINDVTKFPDPLGMGAVSSADVIRAVGAARGREIWAIGVNMNLAPVVDLSLPQDMRNPNSVLFRRTLGDDPQRVGWVAARYSEGLASEGVIAVAKHYPGHGGASDSHLALPVIDTPAEEARATALHSFEVAVAEGVPVVMVGHLYYSALEPAERLPASLSPTMLSILREDFGFAGIIMTDAMDMAALAGNYQIVDAAVMAISAGVDMLTMGPNVSWETQRGAIDSVIHAVRSGEISESRIDESVRRILRLKAHYGILTREPSDPAAIEAIDPNIAQDALIDLYRHAATVLQDQSGLLPLRPYDDLAVIYPAVYEYIFNTCTGIAPDVDYYGFTRFPSAYDYNATSRLGGTHEKVLIFIEDISLQPGQGELAHLLPPEKTVIIALNDPYDLEGFADYSTLMAMYNTLPASHIAACETVFGDQPISGRTPLQIGDFPSGTGLDYRAYRRQFQRALLSSTEE